jgi:hypothetical protein
LLDHDVDVIDQRSLSRFIGVYDANGTLAGELAYLFRRSVARQHCSLCDITHGRVRERAEWRAARTRLPVPFEAFHRNDQPDAIRAVTGGRAPVVVAEHRDGRIELVLDNDELEACSGSPQRLVDRVLAKVGGDEAT